MLITVLEKISFKNMVSLSYFFNRLIIFISTRPHSSSSVAAAALTVAGHTARSVDVRAGHCSHHAATTRAAMSRARALAAAETRLFQTDGGAAPSQRQRQCWLCGWTCQRAGRLVVLVIIVTAVWRCDRVLLWYLFVLVLVL